MTRYLPFFLFLLNCLACNSPAPQPNIQIQQTTRWQTDISGNDLTLLSAIATAPNADGYWLAGQAAQQRKLKNWVLHLDTAGKITRQREWIDSLAVVWNSIQPLGKDALWLCGEFASSRGAESTTLKTDTAGKVLWRRDWHEWGIHTILPLNDTSLLLLGHTASDSVPDSNYWLEIIDTTGSTLFATTWGEAEKDESLHAAHQSASGNIWVLGRSTALTQKRKGDALVAQFSPKGNLIWEKNYGGKEDDYLSDIVEIGDGSYVLVGQTNSRGAGKSDVWLLGIDAQGTVLWEQTYGGLFEDWAATALLHNGVLLVAAKYDGNGEGDSEVWLLATDKMGNLVWENKWNIGNFDAAVALIPAMHKNRFLLLATGTPVGSTQAMSQVLELEIRVE